MSPFATAPKPETILLVRAYARAQSGGIENVYENPIHRSMLDSSEKDFALAIEYMAEASNETVTAVLERMKGGIRFPYNPRPK